MNYSKLIKRKGPVCLYECLHKDGTTSHLPYRWFTVRLQKRKHPDWKTAVYHKTLQDGIAHLGR
jgi:hypothetical protein